MATFQAPVTLSVATLTFTDSNETWTLRIGSLDPINTLSGIFQRLQHLGYIPLERGARRGRPDGAEARSLLLQVAGHPTARRLLERRRFRRRRRRGRKATAKAARPTPAPTPMMIDDDSVNLSFADDLWCPDDCGLSDDGTLPPDLEASLLRQRRRLNLTACRRWRARAERFRAPARPCRRCSR